MDYYFNETMFPSLGIHKTSMDEKKKAEIFSSNEKKSLCHLDSHTIECENEIIQLPIPVVNVFQLE